MTLDIQLPVCFHVGVSETPTTPEANMTLSVIKREHVPAGSFRYGQLASIEGLDAPADNWLIGTPCAKFNDDNQFVGYVLCIHFLVSDEAEAREIAADISRNHETTLVEPSVSVAKRNLSQAW